MAGRYLDALDTLVSTGDEQPARDTLTDLTKILTPVDRTKSGYVVQCPLCGATVTDGECDHCGADGIGGAS